MNLGVDALIGDQFDLMFIQGREDQDARALLRDMDAVRQELLQGGLPHTAAPDAGRGHQTTHSRNTGQQKDADEDDGLRQGVEALRDVLRHLDKVDDAEEEGAADVDGGIVLPLIVAKTVRVYALAGVLSWVSADRRELRVQVRRTN